MKTGEKYYGNYRAVVIDNYDKELYGRVLLWIPDIMPKVSPDKGLWAFPANNPMGGRNSENENAKYNGSSFVPEKGSWVWVFFEGGNPNRPYYFGGLDIKASLILPECQLGSEPYLKWVIFKSKNGRCIVISDDEDDCRVEITGKKRQISSPPAGDTGSVYTIDGNQTSVFLDERSGKEKLLIRTHKGDFINIDIEKRTLNVQFDSDIQIKSNGKINIESTGDINVKTSANLKQSASGQINLKSDSNTNIQSSSSLNLKSSSKANLDSSIINLKSSGNVVLGGSSVITSCIIIAPDVTQGSASPEAAGSATEAESANPVGERDS